MTFITETMYKRLFRSAAYEDMHRYGFLYADFSLKMCGSSISVLTKEMIA